MTELNALWSDWPTYYVIHLRIFLPIGHPKIISLIFSSTPSPANAQREELDGKGRAEWTHGIRSAIHTLKMNNWWVSNTLYQNQPTAELLCVCPHKIPSIPQQSCHNPHQATSISNIKMPVCSHQSELYRAPHCTYLLTSTSFHASGQINPWE